MPALISKMMILIQRTLSVISMDWVWLSHLKCVTESVLMMMLTIGKPTSKTGCIHHVRGFLSRVEIISSNVSSNPRRM